MLSDLVFAKKTARQGRCLNRSPQEIGMNTGLVWLIFQHYSKQNVSKSLFRSRVQKRLSIQMIYGLGSFLVRLLLNQQRSVLFLYFLAYKNLLVTLILFPHYIIFAEPIQIFDLSPKKRKLSRVQVEVGLVLKSIQQFSTYPRHPPPASSRPSGSRRSGRRG
jgi:hypothetical protein